MRLNMMLAAALAAVLGVPAAVKAVDPTPESLLDGTRWMEIGAFDKIENIAPEKLLLLHDCFVADIAFIVQDGRLVRYDRGGLSGKSMPASYVKVETEVGRDGGTLFTLHTTTGDGDMPDRYLIDAGGDIMRFQHDGANGSAYMKCMRGAGGAR